MSSQNQTPLRQKILEILRSEPLAVVSTVDPDAIPESATVCYIADEKWNFYFLTHADSRKAENLKYNPNVSIVVGTVLGTHTIQANGAAEIIKPGEKNFDNLLIKFAGLKELYDSPFLKMYRIDFIIVKVKLDWVRFLELDEKTGIEKFSQIIG